MFGTGRLFQVDVLTPLVERSLPVGKEENGGQVGAEAGQTARTSRPPCSRGHPVLHARAGSDGNPGAESAGARPKTAGGLKKRALINIEKRRLV